MKTRFGTAAAFAAGVLTGCLLRSAQSQQPAAKDEKKAAAQPVRDPAAEAVAPQPLPGDRPEAKQTAHDKSDVFDPKNAPPVSPALKDQPNGGKLAGFDSAGTPPGAA